MWNESKRCGVWENQGWKFRGGYPRICSEIFQMQYNMIFSDVKLKQHAILQAEIPRAFRLSGRESRELLSIYNHSINVVFFIIQNIRTYI